MLTEDDAEFLKGIADDMEAMAHHYKLGNYTEELYNDGYYGQKHIVEKEKRINEYTIKAARLRQIAQYIDTLFP